MGRTEIGCPRCGMSLMGRVEGKLWCPNGACELTAAQLGPDELRQEQILAQLRESNRLLRLIEKRIPED